MGDGGHLPGRKFYLRGKRTGGNDVGARGNVGGGSPHVP